MERTRIRVAIENIEYQIKEVELEILLKQKEKDILRSKKNDLEKLENDKSFDS